MIVYRVNNYKFTRTQSRHRQVLEPGEAEMRSWICESNRVLSRTAETRQAKFSRGNGPSPTAR